MRAQRDDTVFRILQDEIPGLTHGDLGVPFGRLNIDSFGFVSLRARLEHHLGRQISDHNWISAACPADIVRMVSSDEFV